MEQINVTPIGKFTFILSKLIPYRMIGLVILSIGFFIAFAVVFNVWAVVSYRKRD